MIYYKFLRKGTYTTLYRHTELPPPGYSSSPIHNIQPSGSSGTNSGIGYHVYTDRILPYITGEYYMTCADLWVIKLHGQIRSYEVVRDVPASVFPPYPMPCVVAESIELIKKIPFIIMGGKLTIDT